MNRRAVGRVVRLVVSAAIIIFLIAFARTIKWGEAWHSIRNASLPLLAAALAVNILSLLVRGVRWWILLRAAGSPSLGLALRATVAGAGLNNVLIANGGDAARVVFVTRASGLSSSTVLATVALDRLFDPVGFVALLAYGAVMFQLPPDLARLRTPAIVVVVLITAVLVWLAMRAEDEAPEFVPERRAAPRSWRGRLRAYLVEFGTGMRTLATGPRIVAIIGLTLAAWLGQLATFALAASAAHVRIPLAGSLSALLAVNISLIIRATPGNVGFFQFAYALAAAAFNVSRYAAIAVSLLIQTLQIIPVTILGVALAPEFVLHRKTAPPSVP